MRQASQEWKLKTTNINIFPEQEKKKKKFTKHYDGSGV